MGKKVLHLLEFIKGDKLSCQTKMICYNNFTLADKSNKPALCLWLLFIDTLALVNIFAMPPLTYTRQSDKLLLALFNAMVLV